MTTNKRFFNRPRLWGLLCGLTLAVAQLFTPAGVGTAQAATTSCTPNDHCTITFDFTGAAETWTVPASVTQATFDLSGAQGGWAPYGGKGGQVMATLTVVPGATYQILVGGYPGNSASPGFNGGGAAGSPSGGGGGGASDVRTGTFALAGRILVAGGGGGGTTILDSIFGGAGGYPNGGAGTTPGFDANGGGGGTQSAGGAGGFGTNTINNGGAGSLGQGGNGGAGGYSSGGGGGYYGGGGGGAKSGSSTGGGGGGGSSFGPSGATFQNGVRDGNGLVTISYTQPDTTAPVANPTQSPVANASGWTTSQNVTVNWNWTDNDSGIEPTQCDMSSNSGNALGTLTLTAFCVDRLGNLGSASYTLKIDPFAPTIVGTRSPAASGFGWNNSAVTVSFTCSDGSLSGVATNTVAGATLSSEGANQAVTNTGACVDNAGNVATPVTVGPINIDLTKPTLSAAATIPANANGWYNNDVTVHFTCADGLAGIITCPADQVLSGEGAAINSTAQTSTDKAQNVSDLSNVVTVKIDKTLPVVTLTGVTNGAIYPFGSVPASACNTTDALAGVATQATLSVTGGNPDGSGAFTATCSGATDLAGNSAAPISVNYTVGPPPPTATPTNTAVPPTATPTNTAVPPTDTPTNTPVPPTATPTNTDVPPTATPTNTPVPPTAMPTPAADACLTPGLLDNFNRANGGLGGNWAGLIDQSFYKLASNRVDVQLGGPVVWKPTTFGVNQAAFVTLSTLDALSPSQGVLLKVQSGTIPNAGAIAVVYDSLVKAVRVSTLRLNTAAWTAYGNTPATFANGDKLGGCVKADGTVRIYQNNSLLTTVTMNAADQSFFNAKGGKIGLWTIAAPNAFFDDFGSGALDGVSAAETPDAEPSPDATALTNTIFLPLVSR